jgi:hypothetical protein
MVVEVEETEGKEIIPDGMKDHWDEAYELGQRDMLAKCIEAVDGAGNKAGSWRASDQPSEDYFVAIVDALTALRALQEKQ